VVVGGAADGAAFILHGGASSGVVS
jgi:hypothetical protein